MTNELWAYVVNGVVVNIDMWGSNFSLDFIRRNARSRYGDNTDVVHVTVLPCTLGDLYHHGQFWRIDPKTREEKMIILTEVFEKTYKESLI